MSECYCSMWPQFHSTEDQETWLLRIMWGRGHDLIWFQWLLCWSTLKPNTCGNIGVGWIMAWNMEKPMLNRYQRIREIVKISSQNNEQKRDISPAPQISPGPTCHLGIHVHDVANTKLAWAYQYRLDRNLCQECFDKITDKYERKSLYSSCPWWGKRSDMTKVHCLRFVVSKPWVIRPFWELKKAFAFHINIVRSYKNENDQTLVSIIFH